MAERQFNPSDIRTILRTLRETLYDHQDYVEHFENDLTSALTEFLTLFAKLSTQWKSGQVAEGTVLLETMESLLPRLEQVSSDFESMKDELEEISNSLEFVLHLQEDKKPVAQE